MLKSAGSVCPTGGCGAVPAWAVPPQEDFTSLLEFGFLAAKSLWQGKKAWKSTGKYQ